MLYVDVDYSPEICGFCHGTGHLGKSICKACGGQGNVLVVQPARNCPLCNGSGNLGENICRACNGSGWALF